MKLFTSLSVVGLVALSAVSASASLFQPDQSDWYVFDTELASATEDHALGLGSWNTQRAGARGRLACLQDELIYEGAPIKLWGLNNEYADCFPEKPVAEFRAAFYARQGFNSLRQHKYNDGPGWAGIQTGDSLSEFDAASLDRFDYFNAQLMAQGIFLNLSSNFGVKYGPADAERFEAHEDFFDPAKGWGNNRRVDVGHGAICLSPGLQDLHIKQLVTLLEHTNPYTGMTYAEDPGVAFVEIFNEDSVLFYGTAGRLQQSPIMRAYAAERFALWLLEKYGSEGDWVEAWGMPQVVTDPFAIENNHLRGLIAPDKVRGGLQAESLESGVVPWGQPWFYDTTARPQEDAQLSALRPRMLDTMEFLVGLQDEFYAKTVAAIRATGYPGEIIASNWQAGSMTGHFWNMLSDTKVGLIDRHNYFGGSRAGLRLRDGMPHVNNASQLDRPGSGLLSSGMQQVGNRPFMLSEWNVVHPNEWLLEGPAIIGTYGMGLQGWDASYIFASYQDAGFSTNMDDVKKFTIDTPPVMGLMPAISRMVRRGDVTEAEQLAQRHVSMEALRNGAFDFDDFIDQAHDLKAFDGDKIPSETLAVARTAIVFDSNEATEAFDFGDREEAGGVAASTGQLFWSETQGAHNDFFTINSRGTQAFVGFAEAGDRHQAGSFSITPEPGFCAVILTADAPDKDLVTDASALLTLMARARNTGMAFKEDGGVLETVGAAPILMEPVRVTIDFGTRPVSYIQPLDHAGRNQGNPIRLRHNTARIDSAEHQTPYYRVVY